MWRSSQRPTPVGQHERGMLAFDVVVIGARSASSPASVSRGAAADAERRLSDASLCMEPAERPERLAPCSGMLRACLMTDWPGFTLSRASAGRPRQCRLEKESLRVGDISSDSLVRDLGDKQRRFAAVSSELAELRYQIQSDDKTVGVTVNGHGTLLDLRIGPGALRRVHPSMFGPMIASVIQRARKEAGEASRASGRAHRQYRCALG
jgi:DNA-binding protein YbaB